MVRGEGVRRLGEKGEGIKQKTKNTIDNRGKGGRGG